MKRLIGRTRARVVSLVVAGVMGLLAVGWDSVRSQETLATGIVASRDIYLVDGDTADIGGQRYRLVGHDTPETHRPRCEYERVAGEAATRRARQLVGEAGQVELVVLPGRDKYGRGLARLRVQGRDLGDVLVLEGLARRYDGGHRPGWC